MIVLTGGAGFIGSCVLQKLNENNLSDIIVVDHLGFGLKWKNLVGKKFHSYIHKDKFLLELKGRRYDDEIDNIIHLGACADTTETNSDYIIENNLNYSKELALYSQRKNIGFLYASSAATYGNGEFGYSDLEFDKLKPLNPYGLSKHLFDLWLMDNGLDKLFTGLKFFNVFGPNEFHKGDMASMIYKSFNQINSSGKVKLFKSNHPDYKDGEQMRDFIYVKDVVEVIWKIFNRTDVHGIYNLGTGHARSWNDLVNAAFSALNKKVNIEYIDMPSSLANQYQNFTQANMSKLNDTNCSISYSSLEESIKDYIQNYLMAVWRYI